MKLFERKIDEKLWFAQQQRLLLWMANTDYGRDLLCLDKNYPKIHSIKPHAIKMVIEPNLILADYRTVPKWARIIRHRWKEFQEYAQYYYLSNYNFPILFPVANTARQVNFGPYYPAAGSAAPIDGYVASSGVDETFGTIRGDVGNTASGEGSTSSTIYLSSNATTNHFSSMYRTHTCFDTSDIGSGNTIATATVSLYGKSAASTGLGTMNSHIGQSTIANGATTLANSDYSAVTLGTSYGSFSGGSWSTVAYNDHTLDANGIANINKTTANATKFVRMSNWDINNSFGGTWASNTSSDLEAYQADQAGTANDPKLTVTIASASATVYRRLLSLGVGQ